MAAQIIPPKISSNYKDAQDQKFSHAKKEKLSRQARIICNWIYKTPLNGGADPRGNKHMLNTKINFQGAEPLKSLCSIMDQSKSSEGGGDCFSTYSLGSPREDSKNTQQSTIGRDRALLSGATTRRRNKTLRLLRNEFNAINDPLSPAFTSAAVYDSRDGVPATLMNLEKEYFRKNSSIDHSKMRG